LNFGGEIMAEEKRKLSALMQTDICRYTEMVERDEALAMELLEEHNNLIRSWVSNHNGHEIKFMGDSFLVMFPSALQAVRCAIDIQTSLVERNATMPTCRIITIRIGLHLSDLIYRDGDVFGDGVNMLSRIEPLAKPGGIALSRQIYVQVRNQLDIPCVSIGEHELKNIQHPVEIFQAILPWESQKCDVAEKKKSPSTKADLMRVLGLTPELFKHPSYGMLLERIVRNLVRFHQRQNEIDPAAQQLLRQWLANTAELLEGIDANDYIVRLEDVRFHAGRYLRLVGAGDRVYSTNYVHVAIWWDTEIGDNYLRQKVNASRRGAEIVQIMIESDPEALLRDRQLIERLVGPHGERGSYRVFAIDEQEVVRDQCRDVFMVEDKVAFGLDFDSRTWIRGFQICFHPSDAMEELVRYYEDFMQHDALVEYDPHGLYGGEQSYGDFIHRVFPWSHIKLSDVTAH
jgi:class 3 adenylate cyclase